MFLELTPSKNNLLETLSKWGKEFKVSFEFKADSTGGQNDNIIDIGNGKVAVWMDFANTKVIVESPVSGSALKTKMNGFTLGNFHEVEVTQSLIVDKVE